MNSHHPDLEPITADDPATHVYELAAQTLPNQNLGIQQRSEDITVTVQGREYNFKQSISSLNTKGSTTGFVMWKISEPFLNWLLTTDLYDLRGKYVVEIGAGVTGLFACALSSLTETYVATDQAHLMKLLRSNIRDNVTDLESQSIEHISRQLKRTRGRVEAIEFDWEDVDSGLYELSQIHDNRKPDFVIGCDVVYNDYLVPHLVNALESLAGPNTKILIGLHLRLPENIELFVEEVLSRSLRIYRHTETLLPTSLQTGYVIYLITSSSSSTS